MPSLPGRKVISGPRDKRLDFAPERSVSVVVWEAGDTHKVRLPRPPDSVRARPGRGRGIGPRPSTGGEDESQIEPQDTDQTGDRS